MDIDEASNFINDYLDAEYAEAVAVYSEPDEVLAERRATRESFMYSALAAPMSSPLGRGPGWTREKLAESARTMKVVRRVLFLVTEHRHPEWGDIFVGYFSGGKRLTSSSYGGLLYVARVDEGLKVIATYREDRDAVPPPLKWEHVQGVDIPDLGSPIAVRAIVEPRRESHRRHWRELRDLIP